CDGALRLEIGERPVYGDPRRADEGGQVVLGELDLRACVCRRKVEQALRDAPWDVEKTRSSIRPDARRTVRASNLRISRVARGLRSRTRRKSSRASVTTWVWSSAVTVAERGASSKSASSPKTAPSRSTATTISWPSSSGIATFTDPERIT